MKNYVSRILENEYVIKIRGEARKIADILEEFEPIHYFSKRGKNPR